MPTADADRHVRDLSPRKPTTSPRTPTASVCGRPVLVRVGGRLAFIVILTVIVIVRMND